MIAQQITFTQAGPLTAEELESRARAEEIVARAAQLPVGEWARARAQVEAYRNVYGPRLLAQFLEARRSR